MLSKQRLDRRGCPTITLSIDLDLRWGLRNRIGPVAHPVDASLLRVPELVHEMLVELDEFSLPTTWFVPAALTCGSWDEYFATAPDDPRNLPERLRVTTAHRDIDPTGRLHFLPAVLEELLAGGRHELGTTGFSSLSAGYPGVTAADACVEVLAASEQLERATGRIVRSLAFPDDDPAFVGAVATTTGIRNFRGAPRVPSDASRPLQVISRLRSRLAGRVEPEATQGLVAIDHSVRSGLSPLRWERDLRAIARSSAHLAVGENLHVRWKTQPTLDVQLDFIEAIDRFAQLLETLSSGAAQTGALIVPMQRLDHVRRLAA